MGGKRSGRKRKRTSSKSPPQIVNNMDANVNTPVADQLNRTHSVIYNDSIQQQQQNGLIHSSQYPSGTPYNQVPLAPHTTPANPVYDQFQRPSQLSFSCSPSLPLPHMPPMYERAENPRLERFMAEVSQKLLKLDMLDGIVDRIGEIENQCKLLNRDLNDVKRQINNQGKCVDECYTRTVENENRVGHIQGLVQGLMRENSELKERVIETQTRSMRDNLIFRGIPDVQNIKEPKDTESKVKDFITKELGIEENIEFQVVHRLKPRPDHGPRSIVAKFERRKDRNNVLAKSRDKLKDHPRFAVHEQYPVEVIERRKQLIPIMLDARAQGNFATLRDDKLYVNNRRYIPPPVSFQPPPQGQMPPIVNPS